VVDDQPKPLSTSDAFGWRKVSLSLTTVKTALKDFYVDWGRDPWDPVLMFKMVFLQFLYDLWDRDMLN